MTENRIIALVVGPSGSGKTTVCSELEKRYGLKQVHSYTTRPRRPGETEGHVFIAEDEMPDKSEMCAYTYYNGYHYFATHQQVDEADLYVIDPAGVKTFKEWYRGKRIPKVVRIYAPMVDCISRMIQRGDTEDQVIDRVRVDNQEFAGLDADVIVVNVDLETCVDEVYNYLCEQEGKLQSDEEGTDADI